MLKKLIKKEVMLFDVPARISGVGAIPRGLYTRIEYINGFSWFNQKGTEVFGWDTILEEEYQNASDV